MDYLRMNYFKNELLKVGFELNKNNDAYNAKVN